jgi:ligand-binding SRPBCC domain-containing protein
LREQWIARPVEEVFAFFADATNLEAITPPWLRFRILSPAPIAMGAGALIFYRLRWGRLPLRWVTRIEEWQPPSRFIDVQLRGPYALWHHTHSFEPHEDGTLMRDRVRYALPLGPLGRLTHRLFVRRDLEAIFDYRARKVSDFFQGGIETTDATRLT